MAEISLTIPRTDKKVISGDLIEDSIFWRKTLQETTCYSKNLLVSHCLLHGYHPYDHLGILQCLLSLATYSLFACKQKQNLGISVA